ncbi:RsiW-degrading membrane proteinase PrsW (M82 family) OS=Streptomyces albaduncus OX=68172 GN=FHS32_004620 PE=4 SV=1 [Streptomyces griseoloalbus]
MLTGIGFGAAALSADRQRVRRVLLRLAGCCWQWACTPLWNGSATLGQFGFIAVYGAFMVPTSGLLTWLVVWTRQRELRTVRTELPARTRWPAGCVRRSRSRWVRCGPGASPGSSPASTERRSRGAGGRPVRGVRDVAGVPAAPGPRGEGGGGLRDRERELLLELWHRRAAARPALEHAARLTAPSVPYGAGWAYGPVPAAWAAPGQAPRQAPGQPPYPAYGENPYRR